MFAICLCFDSNCHVKRAAQPSTRSRYNWFLSILSPAILVGYPQTGRYGLSENLAPKVTVCCDATTSNRLFDVQIVLSFFEHGATCLQRRRFPLHFQWHERCGRGDQIKVQGKKMQVRMVDSAANLPVREI